MIFINHLKIVTAAIFTQSEVFLDKPIIVGFKILELSKLRMYERKYDELQPFFEQELIKCQMSLR